MEQGDSSEYADRILEIYHDQIARVRTKDLEKNSDFAMGIVEEFKNFVLEKYSLNVEIIPVGSAFEGLKVHQPDEFDFLVIIMALDSDDYSFLNNRSDHQVSEDFKTMKRYLGEDADALRGLHPILLSRRDCQETPAYWDMREIWPGLYDSFGCLSAQAARDTLYDYTAEFVEAWRSDDIEIPDEDVITGMQVAIKGNPAIKMTIHKSAWPPLKISIDMSPCVRRDFTDDTSTYFIAKRKQVLKSIPDVLVTTGWMCGLMPGTQYDIKSRCDLLWFQTESPDEKDKIDATNYYERRNLRILKSLFKDVVYHTHIWKKIFMDSNMENSFPESPMEFIELFIDVFIGWLQVELARRYHRGSYKCYIEEQPSRYYKRLVAGFNEYENILVRYKDKDIIKWYNKFQKLSSLLEQGNYDHFLWKTIGEEKWSKLNIDVDFPAWVVSDSESEEESSDSDYNY